MIDDVKKIEIQEEYQSLFLINKLSLVVITVLCEIKSYN